MKLVQFHRFAPVNVSPFEQLNVFQREISRLLDLPFSAFTRDPETSAAWTPALDLYEDKDNLYVSLELPGFRKEEFQIALQDGVLSISGERQEEKAASNAEVYRSERIFGRFQRTVTLPKPVQANKVIANYKNGVLAITLPKTEEVRPKQIEVQVN